MHSGIELRRIRKNRRMTLAEVGQETGLSVSYLSDVERGRANPTLETLRKLAEFYQVSVRELVPDNGRPLNGTRPAYPPGFREFINQMGGTVDEEMQDLLMRVEIHARQRAQTKDDWLRYYYSLMSILN